MEDKEGCSEMTSAQASKGLQIHGMQRFMENPHRSNSIEEYEHGGSIDRPGF